jgi:hypothetical protein
LLRAARAEFADPFPRCGVPPAGSQPHIEDIRY